MRIQCWNESRREWDRKAEITFEATAEVLREVQIDSLDVTIVKGGGAEVVEWAKPNGFDIDPSTPEMLDFYGGRSPYFMAARFDAAAARERGFTSGDGVPVHLVMPLDSPWVPLRILSLGKPGASDLSGVWVPQGVQRQPQSRHPGRGSVPRHTARQHQARRVPPPGAERDPWSSGPQGRPALPQRRPLTKSHERLDEAGEAKLLGLVEAGDPKGVVRMT